MRLFIKTTLIFFVVGSFGYISCVDDDHTFDDFLKSIDFHPEAGDADSLIKDTDASAYQVAEEQQKQEAPKTGSEKDSFDLAKGQSAGVALHIPDKADSVTILHDSTIADHLSKDKKDDAETHDVSKLVSIKKESNTDSAEIDSSKKEEDKQLPAQQSSSDNSPSDSSPSDSSPSDKSPSGDLPTELSEKKTDHSNLSKDDHSNDKKNADDLSKNDDPVIESLKTLSPEKAAEEARVDSPASDKKDDTSSGGLQIVDVHAPALDTVSVDAGGNWLEKRIWFKKAEQLYEGIQKSVKKVGDTRMQFVNEVNSTGKKIDDFYDSVRFDEGQVEQLLKDLEGKIKDIAHRRGGDLSPKERHLKTTVADELKQIDQIGKDIALIKQLDDHIDKAMTKAFKVVEECRTYEQKAWKNFKDIGNELDDKKAHDMYYHMDNYNKNVEQKSKYLTTQLLAHLKSKLIGKAEVTMSTIKKNVEKLKTKGVDIEKMLKGEEASDDKVVEEREDEKVKEAVEEDRDKQKRLQEEKEEREKEAAKRHAEQQEREREQTWQYKMMSYMKCIICWLYAASQQFICMAQKVGCIIQKLVCNIVCYMKPMICEAWHWLCSMLGN